MEPRLPMVLACIVIGLMIGICVITFDKWFDFIFSPAYFRIGKNDTIYVECPKCSKKVKRVKSSSQHCNSCHTYF